MKKILILVLFVVSSCDRTPHITIQSVETTIKSGICSPHGEDEITINRSETTLTETDFRICLKTINEGESYIALRRVSCCLETCLNLENTIRVIDEICIVDQNKEIKLFASTNAFLDFMSAGRYEIVDEKKFNNRTDYTFRKIG